MDEKSLDTKVPKTVPNTVSRTAPKMATKVATKTALGERVAKAGGVVKIAQAAGVSKGYVTHICQGNRSPSLDVLARLAVALGVNMTVVIGEIGTARKSGNWSSQPSSGGTHTG